jgi:dihydrofolate reductase
MIYGLVAIERGHGIGFNNKMPWPLLKGDLRWFKEVTTNNIVIMGSNTWKSLPENFRPLPNRVNVVIGRSVFEDADHCFTDPEKAILFCQFTYPSKKVCIIGGQQLYDSTRELIDTFYITEIDEDYTCDKFFNIDFVREKFKKVSIISQVPEEESTPSYTIREYTNETS